MLTHFSDVRWTEDRGHRTPVGSFGTFYQAPVVEEDDGLLMTFKEASVETKIILESSGEKMMFKQQPSFL